MWWFSLKDLQRGGADCSDEAGRLWPQTTPLPHNRPPPPTVVLGGSVSLCPSIRVGTWKAKALEVQVSKTFVHGNTASSRPQGHSPHPPRETGRGRTDFGGERILESSLDR